MNRLVVVQHAAAIICGIVFSANASAQGVKASGPPGSTLSVVPGEHYRAGALHRWVLGDHHRDLWALPLEAQVLDLSTFGGGLTPLRRGGGMQTQSLRLRGRDGKTYVFRMLEKDPSKNISPELRETIVARLLQDQTSGIMPFAALAVDPLLEAADVLHASPRVVIMPDDAALGEFRAEFGATLGMIEERPEVADGRAGFAGAADVINSEDLLDALETSPRNRVDARAYLTARLIDVLIGDFDRHPDQWRWAAYAEAGGTVYRPIPRDRDFAFNRMDGALLRAAIYRYPQLVNFEREYPSIFRLTWSGRALDRRLLVGLEKPAWDSVTLALQARISDARIDLAVNRLPAAYQAKIGEELRRTLSARRDLLHTAADEFYALLAGWVDVHTTDEADSATVTRRADGGIDLQTFTREAGLQNLTYRRSFSPTETNELRVFLHGGTDALVINDAPGAHGGNGITVRAIGGGGNDLLVNAASGGAAAFYDDRGDNQFVHDGGTSVNRREYEAPPPVSHSAQPRDWGARWLPLPWFSYSPDYGLFVGGSAIRNGYGFRKDPYSSRLVLSAGIASTPARLKASITLDRKTSNPKLDLHFGLLASGIEYQRFYGLGNNTTATLSDASYKLPRTDYVAQTAVVFNPTSKLSFALGPQVKVIDSKVDASSLFQSVYGTGQFAETGVLGSARLDTRNSPLMPTSGFLLRAEGAAYPELLDVRSSFGSARVEGATYLSVGGAFPTTLALRGAGTRVWGEHPFHEAAFLGGAESLRGFREQRFAGDAALLGSAELRVKLADIFVVLPEEFGIHGLADAGRVYLDNESPGGWHSAFGGGVWFSIIDRTVLASVSMARGKERTGIYVKGGFAF